MGALAGILFLVPILAMFIIIAWSARNDNVSLKEKTSGILAMRDDEKEKNIE